MKSDHSIAIKCWVEMMKRLWNQDWDVIPSKEESSVEDEKVYEIGYWYSRGGTTKLWECIFTLWPIMKKKRVKTIGKTRMVPQLKWYLETYIEHPGRWNPRDGGDPPCTEEVDLGTHPSLLKALGKITYFETECALLNLGDHVMEEEMAEQERLSPEEEGEILQVIRNK